MAYCYRTPGKQLGDVIGLPGYDSFYHTKMAVMLPEHGLVDSFPWLQLVSFTNKPHEFVSHHVGFHLYLSPFVHLAHALQGDYLIGARWAMAFVFGLNCMLFYMLLRAGQVPWPWVWMLLFFLMPHDFFQRHGYVRAIGPSLVGIQLLLLMLIQKRYILAGLVITGSIYVYLGAVLYMPVVTICYVVAHLIGPADSRSWSWKLAICTFTGWLVGVLIYPYSSGMLDFLILQVTGSGLSPDIQVGNEWRSYNGVWWFVRSSATLIAVFVSATLLRMRLGPPLNGRELALLLLNVLFLGLTLKARRFIEYWPPICMLSSAYLAAPVLTKASDYYRTVFKRHPRISVSVLGVMLASMSVGLIVWSGVLKITSAQVGSILVDWPMWGAIITLAILPRLIAIWCIPKIGLTHRWPFVSVLAVGGCGALIFVVLWLADIVLGTNTRSPLIQYNGIFWAALVAYYLVVPALSFASSNAVYEASLQTALVATGRTIVCALLLASIGLSIGMMQFSKIADKLDCGYDLKSIQTMMEFIQSDSRPGDIIFTDDWDIFPVFFYFNSYNHYLVGLDPKFTQALYPEMWERYVRITRGEVPTKSNVKSGVAGGEPVTMHIDVRLTDIRDLFKARYVITDRDHTRFAAKLAAAPSLAEQVYPQSHDQGGNDSAYKVFRILRPGEIPKVTSNPPLEPDSEGRLFLSQLKPAVVEQGWGYLENDRTVDQRTITIRGRVYKHGLGTHATSNIVYDIPERYEQFCAIVGIDDETGGNGSINVAVYLDGNCVYKSPRIVGNSEPITIRIPLNGARQLQLTADETDDGNRFDHVCWADAHFLRVTGE